MGSRRIEALEARLMAEAIPHIVWVASPDGATTYFNAQGTEYTGCSRETNYDWNWVTLVHPDDAERAREGWEAAVRTETEFALDYRIRRFDGVFRWHEFRARPVRDPEGAIQLWIGTATDVEVRKELELSLRRSEREALETVALLQSIEAAAPVGFKLVDRDLRVVRVNDTLAQVSGMSADEVLGWTVQEMVPDLWPQLEDVYRRVLGGETICGLDLSMASADDPGRVRHWLASYYPVRIQGEIIGVGNAVVEITAQRAQEREITRLHQAQIADGMRFAAVVEALQEGVLVQDAEGRVLQANRTASQILGVPLGQLVTVPPSPLRWSAARPDGNPLASDQNPGRRALARSEPVLGVMVGVDRGDERVWLEINSVPLCLPGEGEQPVVISSFRDVTARVAADEAIRFQALLLDTAGQAIVAVDGNGIVLYWNNMAEHMYGWQASEALNRPFAEFIASGATLKRGRQLVGELSKGATAGSDHWVRRRDGTLFPVFATTTPTLDDKGNAAVIIVATDITDRKRAEDQARRLSAIVESSSDAIIGMTMERVITSWNPGATALFGYDAEEAIGRNVSMLTASAEPGNAQAHLDAADGMSVTNMETQGTTKHGELVQISLSVSPILDEAGQPIGLSSITRDITERVELERIAEESRQALLSAQHAAELEAIGREEANRANLAKSEFLSRMSHELRTPLNAVLGFGQILLMDDLTTDQRENLGFIRSAGEHLLDLINDVLDISRIEAGALQLSLEPVNLHEVVANALSLIGPQAAHNNITTHTAIDDTDLYVHSDRQRLLQVLLNLLSNAVKYNRPGGRIDLCCESSGGTVSIAVTDTGIGMCEADLGKLFTPFERLGAEATDIEGTGVGLALSRVLSQQMGGSLTVFSAVGTGSTFTLELPASQRSEPAVPDDTDARPVRMTASEKVVTILSIEDNVANIRLMERSLQRCHNVVLLTAIQGRLGLEIAIQHQPDLILLDLHLPDLPGETVLQHLRADPATASIPVVICSADASPKQRRECLDRGAAAYLTKPLNLTELFELIERVRAVEPLTNTRTKRSQCHDRRLRP
ncbi:MAG: PAS domain S-box protein [Ilumatobacteraceae bacterium]